MDHVLLLRRLTIATLTGSFMVTHRLNPIRAESWKETYKKRTNDYDEKVEAALAEEKPECALGREALIASAFETYKECRQIPEKYRNL